MLPIRHSLIGKWSGIIKDSYFASKNMIREKMRESAVSVLPIVLIVVLLCLTVSPIPTGLMLSFLIGTLMIILGMGLFSLGAELSMTPIGNRIGTALTKTRKLPLILGVSFALGFAVTIAEPDLRKKPTPMPTVTIAEPDLQVLAATVPHIDSAVLLVTVGIGVGFFLSVCMLRILTGIKLRWLLILFYAIVFILAGFTDAGFLAVAFDSGGVTTGPMTVPFILALGVGISHIRSDKDAEADSFGLVALCSIGPIVAVMILGFFYSGSESSITPVFAEYADTAEIGSAYISALPLYIKEMAVALLPIVAIFFIFQFAALKMSRRSLLRICIGILYTYVGLVLFLTGVGVGFSSLGSVLGSSLAGTAKYALIPLSMLLGWFII